MLAPTPSPRPLQHTDFNRLVDDASHLYVEYRNSPEYAADYGVTTEILDQYADGQVQGEDRNYVQSVLCRCPWALEYVTTRVKARRESED